MRFAVESNCALVYVSVSEYCSETIHFPFFRYALCDVIFLCAALLSLSSVVFVYMIWICIFLADTLTHVLYWWRERDWKGVRMSEWSWDGDRERESAHIDCNGNGNVMVHLSLFIQPQILHTLSHMYCDSNSYQSIEVHIITLIAPSNAAAVAAATAD